MNMKKIVALVLALVLCCTQCCMALCEDETEYFEPTICNGLDKTASEWMSSSSNRALLTVCLLMDALIDSDLNTLLPNFSLANALSTTSYVYEEDGVIIVMLADKELGKGVAILYGPLSGVASNATLSSSDLAAYVQMGYPTAIKNDQDDIMEHVRMITEILNEE